uniref:Uncharacterized protein LOC114343387 n=1 Tax=Diabrotica virgifera virgifera TaxID=50390 RepID=A0A6P7GK22_DIAVI
MQQTVGHQSVDLNGDLTLATQTRFDRAVEKELQRRRDTSLNGNLPTGLAETIMPAKDLNLPKSLIDKMAEATASRIETVSQMSMIPDTELSDVVDKFAKAEAMCAFAGAVKAAEAAAEELMFRASTRQAMTPTNSNATNGWTPECRFEWRLNSSYTNQDKEENTKFQNLQKDQLAELAQKEISPKKDTRFLLQKLIMEEDGSPTDPTIASQRQESIMQWFDRAVEKELQRRRDTSLNGNLPTGLAETIMPAKDLNLPKSLIDKMAEATASRIETVSQMSMIPDTELSDVVDKFAKAEAMCAFAGAVKAAEAAAE